MLVSSKHNTLPFKYIYQPQGWTTSAIPPMLFQLKWLPHYALPTRQVILSGLYETRIPANKFHLPLDINLTDMIATNEANAKKPQQKFDNLRKLSPGFQLTIMLFNRLTTPQLIKALKMHNARPLLDKGFAKAFPENCCLGLNIHNTPHFRGTA